MTSEAETCVVKMRWNIPTPAHIRVTIFVGVDGDHLANTGELTFLHDEARRFRASIRQGIIGPGFTGVLESGWPFES